MEKITVAYWYGRLENITGIKHNQQYEYSIEKRNEIIDLVLDKGLNIMLHQVDNRKNLVIWIDNKKFQQR
jgi:hypothetical protein